MIKIQILLIALVICLINAFDDPKEYEKLILKIHNDPVLHKNFADNVKYLQSLDENYLDYQPLNANTDCNENKIDFSKLKKAENVHELKPSDIKVIAALGDSLTAAFGAEAATPLGLLIENRGMSWDIGGAKSLFKKRVTVANILKEFNPYLTGFSTRAQLFFEGAQNLDVAISGQKAQHMPTQALNLIKKMKADKNIDYENDWKLVNLFIGGNDLCQFCKTDIHKPETWIDNIKIALDILKEEMPRTLVNFVSVLNVKDMRDMNRGLVCGLLHEFECKCVSYPKDQKQVDEYPAYFKNYTRLSKELVDTGRYDVKDDFTVVLQPFFEDFLVPRLSNGKVDLSYFAPDCFHLSPKGHELIAVGLWNNMMEPVGKKSKTLELDHKIICPTEEHPFIYTRKNSK